jgi:integrase
MATVNPDRSTIMEKSFKITRRKLDAIRPEKDGSAHGTTFTDSELKGFHVVVFSSGAISYAVRFRVNGQRRTLAIGDFPAMAPEAARTLAEGIRTAAKNGIDETEVRKAKRAEADEKTKRVTFGAWRISYMKDVTQRRLKSSSEIERYLVLTSAWDARPMAEITAKDVRVFRDRIADGGKTKRTTSANRWFTTLAACFATAVRDEHVEKNPFKLLKRLPENAPRRRVLSKDEEKRVREVLATWPNVFEKTAFAIMLDTGARVGEVLAAKHEDFTLDEDGAGLWQLPKTKSGVPQVVPILGAVGKLIAAAPKLTDCEFLIPGRNGLARRHDLRGPWAELKAAAKLGDDVHVHDIRRSYGLRAALGIGMLGASKLLRHSSQSVTEKIYAPMTAEHLVTFAKATEKARVKAAKVLPFRKTA